MSEDLVHASVKRLISTTKSVVQGADTPEDAYKRFMAAAGKGMMQVMADALNAAVSQSVNLTKGMSNIDGWEKFVTGCAVAFDFGAPIDVTALTSDSGTATPIDFQKVLVTKLAGRAVPAPPHSASPSLFGVTIGVQGTWSF